MYGGSKENKRVYFGFHRENVEENCKFDDDPSVYPTPSHVVSTSRSFQLH